jgi:hypothetical protein
MSALLNPVLVRRLLARTLTVALAGGPAPAQLLERWGLADASDDAWDSALLWDGIGAPIGWAVEALDLRDVIPPEVDDQATSAYDESRRQNAVLRAELADIGAEFERSDVQGVAVKASGLLAGDVEPAPGVRWVGEIDLLVRESDLEQAAGALQALAYDRLDPPGTSLSALARPYRESFTSATGRSVDLHWRLGPTRWGPAADTAGWFKRATPSPLRGILAPAPSDLFWHLLVHDARNHAWSSGSLRAALDLAMVARAEGFALGDVLALLDDDPRRAPLLDAIADAAHLSPILGAEIEPSPEPRYLRLARWRDMLGRRRWNPRMIADAVAWGATLDRARRFGGWRGVAERAAAVPQQRSAGLLASLGAALRAVRHATFVGGLTAAHLLSVASGRRPHRGELAGPGPRGGR